MNTLIKIGTTLNLTSSSGVLTQPQAVIVKSFIGGGGQGEVYKVLAYGKEYALKWYFKRNQKKALKDNLKALIKLGSPSENFLWPKQLVEHGGQFGYLMELRQENYKKSQKLMEREFSLSYSLVCNVALNLADSFRKLHVKGLSYQDISWGNIFIDPEDGKILICDNDNIAPHGSNTIGISGTYGFMAPEVVLNEQKPDQYSDLFSLAILLFQILFLEHPFNGRRWANIACWDDYAKKKLYGSEPIFIFDPVNKENRPMIGVQDNAKIFWNMYPRHIHECFINVFTKGLKNRENGRLLEEDWIEAFRVLRESIMICPACGREVIFKEKEGLKCWGKNCEAELPPPPRLKIKLGKRERIIVLNPNTKLYTYQLTSHEPDFIKGDIPLGEMVQSPENPNKWGIRNLSKEPWSCTRKDETKETPPGKAFVLNSGIKINFKTATGELII
ncbi:MAG: serine/threonine-protein kinase [Defluviitaleaceae bacterium]|nr:serine/threonine-protein kinase [Defluviitaleaceae bacterium]